MSGNVVIEHFQKLFQFNFIYLREQAHKNAFEKIDANRDGILTLREFSLLTFKELKKLMTK